MKAQIIDGRTLSQQICGELLQRSTKLRAEGITPKIVVLLVGENPASQSYVRNKEKRAEATGVMSVVHRLPESTSQQALLELVQQANEDPSVHGILVQLPLPAHIDPQAVLLAISPQKDVDGFHAYNAGALMTGSHGFISCTPKGVMRMLDSIGADITSKHAVVVGRSNIVGKPVSMLLLERSATVTMCHSKTADLASYTRSADVLVVAVGRPELIKGDMIKPGAIVIDVGMNRVNDAWVGDVDFQSASEVASYITPVPGGVGQMTTLMLMENTIEAAERAGNA